jgi:hypothetical protein
LLHGGVPGVYFGLLRGRGLRHRGGDFFFRHGVRFR